MIVGGFDRQLPLEDFSKNVQSNSDTIRGILLIGASAHRVSESLKSFGFNNFILSPAHNIQEIVTDARNWPSPVMLSSCLRVSRVLTCLKTSKKEVCCIRKS